MGDVGGDPLPLPVYFLSADDIDPILARFPGPVAIAPGGYNRTLGRWLARTQPFGGIGCGLFIGVLILPVVALMVEAILGGSRETAFGASAACQPCVHARAWPATLLSCPRPPGYCSTKWDDLPDLQMDGCERFSPRRRHPPSANPVQEFRSGGESTSRCGIGGGHAQVPLPPSRCGPCLADQSMAQPGACSPIGCDRSRRKRVVLKVFAGDPPPTRAEPNS
jgi:hypothetical protein